MSSRDPFDDRGVGAAIGRPEVIHGRNLANTPQGSPVPAGAGLELLESFGVRSPDRVATVD